RGAGLTGLATALMLVVSWNVAAAQQPAAPAQAPAQMNMADHRGALQGKVTNEAGAPVPDATVTAISAENGAQFTSTTNAQGVYSFGALPVGQYNISIATAGLTAYRRANVAVDMD